MVVDPLYRRSYDQVINLDLRLGLLELGSDFMFRSWDLEFPFGSRCVAELLVLRIVILLNEA